LGHPPTNLPTKSETEARVARLPKRTPVKWGSYPLLPNLEDISSKHLHEAHKRECAMCPGMQRAEVLHAKRRGRNRRKLRASHITTLGHVPKTIPWPTFKKPAWFCPAAIPHDDTCNARQKSIVLPETLEKLRFVLVKTLVCPAESVQPHVLRTAEVVAEKFVVVVVIQGG